MPDIKTKISLEDSKKVLKLYLKILDKFRWWSLSAIFSGFLLRGISIVIFVLILRIFMNIIEPVAGLESINKLLIEYFQTTIDERTMVLSLLSVLTGLVIVQFLIGKINLYVTLTARAQLLEFCLTHPFNDHRDTHLHISIDHIPPGYDAVIKSSEILLFYAVLLICIFYMSPLMGLAVLVSVPLVLAILLLKGRKEVFVVQDFREVRKNYQSENDTDSLNSLISLSNQSFSFPTKDMINSQMTSNMAIVLIMITFMAFYEDFEFQGIAALLLVFSIRYSLIYAGELSRFLNRLLKQRTIVGKIHYNPFL